MTTAARALPHWDMTVIYPGLESPAFEAGFKEAVDDIAALAALWDEYDVGLREPAPLDDATAPAVETVIDRYNAVLARLTTLSTYIYSFITTDSRDDVAQAAQSRLQQQTMLLSQLGTRFVAWIGSLDVEGLIERSETARAHAFALRQAREQARRLMSPAEEALAAELELTGGTAWAKLYSNVASQLLVPVELDGERRELPMSEIRNLSHNPDRDVRRRAYEAELDAWSHAAVPIAAALNSIKGQGNALSARRGWASPLDVALFGNNIDRATLDAMLEAAYASFPDFRRYLRAKARALGVPALAWYDLNAPIGVDREPWGWDDAERFIVEQFGGFAPRLRQLAARAFRERWIDAEPRPGKRDGAFCTLLRGPESRILANYSPVFDSVSTLAHELGHAYHNLNLAERTMLQRSTPMTLAETASTFCETIIMQAGLRRADAQGQLLLLESSLGGACQIVVDITSRYLFESRVFAARKERELSVDDFKRLMTEAQAETYGDGLDADTYHPYMWAVKSHYYSAGRSYYNFPYMFGQLFGLGLYARYQDDPERFVAGYDDLLSSTGLADAATLAARFGIDIRTPDFWTASLDVVRRDIDRFASLVPAAG